jgi:hypothetical protein
MKPPIANTVFVIVTAITSGTVPNADPHGPITDDFKRGACYVLDLWNQTLNMPGGQRIEMSGDNSFACPSTPVEKVTE